MFLKILGILIGLVFVYIGLRLVLNPRKIIKNMQMVKYKSYSEPQKNAVVMTVIIGVLLTLIGLYYTIFAILSIIYPA
jgi:hypothetical protein